jgi:hypothetical protein
VPLDEELEAYEVEILDRSTVKRVLSVSTTSTIYTAVLQTADWGALLGPGDTLDVRISQLSVLDRDLTAPPDSPSDGDRYIVGSGATGDRAGWDPNVALWSESAWLRLPPRIGWRAWVEDEGLLLVYDGASWIGTARSSTALSRRSQRKIGSPSDERLLFPSAEAGRSLGNDRVADFSDPRRCSTIRRLENTVDNSDAPRRSAPPPKRSFMPTRMVPTVTIRSPRLFDIEDAGWIRHGSWVSSAAWKNLP